MIKSLLKTITRKFGIEVRRSNTKFISVQPKKKCRGNVLLSYITEPFLLKKGEPISNAHHHEWLSWQIGQTFLDFGYAVDVIQYTNETFIPR